MKNLLLPLIFSTASLVTAEDAPPPVEHLLMTARYVTTLQKHDLKGQLRKDGKKVPVILFLNRKQGDIQFQYLPEGQKDWKKARIFHMRLKADRYDLFELKDGKTLDFPASKLSESIEKTDLTYDDLAMRFLYWLGGRHKSGKTCYLHPNRRFLESIKFGGYLQGFLFTLILAI